MEYPRLKPDFARFLEEMAAATGASAISPSVEDRRSRTRRISQHFRSPYPQLSSVRDFSVPEAGRQIGVRLYRPSERPSLPAIVYFHGGGWMTGDLDSHDYLAASLCQGIGAVVISVDYRLSPEHRYPAALVDCRSVVEFARRESEDLDIDPLRIGVAGDSAGAQLALACAMSNRDMGRAPLAVQLLAYPAVDIKAAGKSHFQYANAPILTSSDMQLFWAEYVGPDGPLSGDPYLSPLDSNLSGLPPAYVVAAQVDPLRDEGLELGMRLAGSGVEVEMREAQGLCHGFLRALAICESVQDEFGRMVAFARKVMI